MDNLQTQLTQIMQTLQLDDAPAGGSLVVYHKGKRIAAANVGNATPYEEWDKDTLSLNFSTGKGVLVTLIHILVSNKILAFDDAIAKYWPEFATSAKQDITLRDVLTHRSGLFNIQAITDNADDMTNWALMLSRVEQMQPQQPFNKKVESAYSALVSGWVLGGLIERATGMTLNAALDTYLAEPLDIKGDVYFGVPEAKLSHVATLAKNFDHFDSLIGLEAKTNSKPPESNQRNRKPKLRVETPSLLEAYKSLPSYQCWQNIVKIKDNSDNLLKTLDIVNLYFDMSNIDLHDFKDALLPQGRSSFNYYNAKSLMAKIPAANNVATADALARMYAMLANKGMWNQRQLISPEVFDELSKIYVEGSDAIMPAANPNSMLWRLGYHRIFSICQDLTNMNNAFGHMGYNGSVAWCDTDRDLAVAYVHNYDVTMSTDMRQFAIIEAILELVVNSGNFSPKIHP